MKNILSICVLLSLVCVGFAENVGSTNREETHLQLKNRVKRCWDGMPCPSNMIGGHSSSKNNAWRCRCERGYLYLRSENDCYLPYRRGPCPPGHYVYYGVNSTTAECVVNPCLEDGLVLYNGTCHKIGKWGEGPCGDSALVTDRETLQLRCLEGNEYFQMGNQLSCSGDRSLVPRYWEPSTSSPKCECPELYNVYFPSAERCYKPYMQGPCSPGQYVYMAINETVPQCVVNPCSKDGLVPYEGKCFKLAVWGEEVCNHQGLVVDPSDFQLKCSDEVAGPFTSVLIQCPTDMLFVWYPEDKKSSKCRCQNDHRDLYVPSYDQCHPVYRQGPCLSGQYVYLPINETWSQCVSNPCSVDGLVPYNGSCHEFAVWGEGPCNFGALVADPDTFQLKCIEEITDPDTVVQQLKCSDDRILETFGSKNASDWTCKCKHSSHYYFPSKNGCYPLYKQGPCPSGQYVYMAINATVPQCVVNACHEDGLVPYHGNCYKFAMWGENACKFGALVPDPVTLELKCIGDITITDFPSLIDLIKCPGNLVLIGTWLHAPRYWHCECSRYNDLYFPSLQSCYEPYTQGPCLPGHIVYRAVNETAIQCVVNPCLEDGLVLYNGTCHKLGVLGGPACGADRYLEVDRSTLQIVCTERIRLSTYSRDHLVLIVVPDSECEPDIANDPNGVCMKSL